MSLESIKYSNGKLEILDQLLLPTETKYIPIKNVEEGWDAIRLMKVRGAPAIAIVGCLSLAVELPSLEFSCKTKLRETIVNKLNYLVSARPTAVNMKLASDALSSLSEQLEKDNTVSFEEMRTRLEKTIVEMLEKDLADNRAIGKFGSEAILAAAGSNKVRILTHCNTGSLATAGYGTALGVIRALEEQDKLEHVYCTETRPYNQGARLTAYELVHEKMPATLVCDSAVAALMKSTKISAVVVGADRVAANGDTANKIGTYQIAVIAKHHNVPFYVAAPNTSIDKNLSTGQEIVIEERPEKEMTHVANVRIAAPGISSWNPAFDVTPAELITGIITENGVRSPHKLCCEVGAMTSDSPSPFVYWAQDADNVFLKVDLKDITDKEINLQEDEVHMQAYGIGAHGPTNYSFNLKFFDNVQTSDDISQYIKISDRAVQFILKKQENKWWPRLIKTQQKPAWLKIDFERWKSEDDDEGSDSGFYRNGTTAKDVLGDYPHLYEKLKKDEFGYMKEDYRKVYLVFYNLSQFVFFTYILVVMIIRYAKEGPDSMAGTYEAVGSVFKFCQLMQFLEVMHPMFGYTKGNVLIPLLQVSGRALILFAMVDAEPRMQTKPVVFYMFFIWALVEVVRYPYYIGQVYKINIDLLTWLRYSVWIPLYPLGILCEGIIILRNIPYFEETGRFSVSMPNSWNFTFHCPTVMKLYLLILFVPGMYAMMTHMYKARMKKLGPKKWRSKFE